VELRERLVGELEERMGGDTKDRSFDDESPIVDDFLDCQG